ncbi:MAG: hypothetical protein JWN70_4046 [Planctomycetaceae bacterium]|nr:hypothetical protein [Planctomycetaceae bacterium]
MAILKGISILEDVACPLLLWPAINDRGASGSGRWEPVSFWGAVLSDLVIEAHREAHRHSGWRLLLVMLIGLTIVGRSHHLKLLTDIKKLPAQNSWLEREVKDFQTLLPPRLPWSAEQATGAPDESRAGNTKFWAPATRDSRSEWLQLEYEREIAISTIVIQEAYASGRVTRICAVDHKGLETPIWSGATRHSKPSKSVGPIPAFKIEFPEIPQKYALYKSKTQRLKLYFDSPEPMGCFGIDAVGLQESSDKTFWAVKATASSSHGLANWQLYVIVKSSFMQEKWYPWEQMDSDF